MSTWAEIATMAQNPHPDGGYMVRYADGSSESCSEEGMTRLITYQRLIDRYIDGLEAWRETRPAICASHNLMVVSGEWMVNDYRDGWDEDRPLFMYFGHHVRGAEPWCCIELWAEGRNGNLVCMLEPQP